MGRTIRRVVSGSGSGEFRFRDRGRMATIGRSAPVADLPLRIRSALNPTYGPLTAESFADFEWLVFLDSTTYPRGAMPLTSWNAEAN